MDFVVAGLGIGALLVVIGFAVRDLGPVIRRGNADGAGSRFGAAPDRDRLIVTTWVALSAAGGIVLVATFAAILLSVSDTVGTWIVAASVVAGAGTAAAIGYRSLRFGALRGVLLPLRETRAPDSGAADYRWPSGLCVPTGRASDIPHEVSFARTDDLEQGNRPSAGADDGAFDPTKLLPQEFDDHRDSQAAGIETSSGEPENVPVYGPEGPPAPSGSPELPEPGVLQTPAAPDMSSETANSEVPPAKRSGTAETETAAADAPILGTAGFRSPLLAGIEADGSPEGPAEFSSQLLADVAPDGTAGESFASPLLADVTAVSPEPGAPPASAESGPSQRDDESASESPELRSIEDDTEERARGVG